MKDDEGAVRAELESRGHETELERRRATDVRRRVAAVERNAEQFRSAVDQLPVLSNYLSSGTTPAGAVHQLPANA